MGSKNSWARGIFDKFFRVYFKAEVARQCEQHLILPRLVREKIQLKFRPTFHLITIKNFEFRLLTMKIYAFVLN